MTEQTTTVHGKPAVKVLAGRYAGNTAQLFKLHTTAIRQEATLILRTGAQIRVASSEWKYAR
jgi:hypothetical protein